MTVLDASALLALIHDEAGSDIAAEIVGSVLGAANLAEVVGKLVDAEVDVARLRELLSAAGVSVEPLSADDAELAGAMRSLYVADRSTASWAQRVQTATMNRWLQ